MLCIVAGFFDKAMAGGFYLAKFTAGRGNFPALERYLETNFLDSRK